MAVVFSLPWALLIWSYAYSYSNFHINVFYGIADVSNRMLLFLIAVITYAWSVSNLWSRIAIGSISALVFSLLVGCMWTIWESSNGLGVWLVAFAYPFLLCCELRMSGSHAFVMGLCHSAIVPILSLQIMAANTRWLARGIVSLVVVQFNVSGLFFIERGCKCIRFYYVMYSCLGYDVIWISTMV